MKDNKTNNKRELFVFAGQSNMMGACVYPAKEQMIYNNSFEYLHKPKRLGKKQGEFKNYAFPCGEFAYKNLEDAYKKENVINGKSTINNYSLNSYFCPSMANLKSEQDKSLIPFADFSEATMPLASSLAPYIVNEWEKLGNKCAYSHIAKGGVAINYYFNQEMIDSLNDLILEYNLKSGENLPLQTLCDNGADYFFEKSKDFFIDSEDNFKGEDLSTKCFFFLQGESDANIDKNLYKLYLKTLWEYLKKIGFTHFFCIRVGFWGCDGIANVMKAQEEFCLETEGAYMLTRVCSFIPYNGQNLDKWYAKDSVNDYLDCRDSFYGFVNNHVNEKGFKLIAKSAIKNIKRVLIDKTSTVLEDELCLPLTETPITALP